MKWLESYRHQLAEEAAGRSVRFSRVLRYFRSFFQLCVAAGMAFIGYGIWYVTSFPGDGTGGMAFILFPFGALMISTVGLVTYGVAKLFLSVEAKSNG